MRYVTRALLGLAGVATVVNIWRLGLLDGFLFTAYVALTLGVSCFLSEWVHLSCLFLCLLLPARLWPPGLLAGVGGLVARRILKEMKAAVNMEEHLSKEVLEHLSQMIFVYGLNHQTGRTKLLYTSGRCRDLMGVEPEVAVSDSFDLYYRVHPEDRERFLLEVTQAATEMRGFLTEVRMLGAEGRYRWIRIKSKIQPGRWGRSHEETLWFGVCDDISDLMKKRSELSEEKSVIETLEAVLSATFDVTLYVNSEYKVTKDSAKLRHFFGMEDQRVAGVDFRDFIAEGHLVFEQYMSRCASRRATRFAAGSVASGGDAMAQLWLRIAEDEVVSCEVYGSGLPWPLEGDFLIGIKVGDFRYHEAPVFAGPSSPSTAATDEEQLTTLAATPTLDTQRLLKVGFQGNILELSARVGSLLLNKDQFFAHASVGEVEEALAFLPLREPVAWRMFVIMCVEFRALRVLIRHLPEAVSGETRVLVFLGICELLLADPPEVMTLAELRVIFENLVGEASVMEKLLQVVTTIQMGVVCDVCGDEDAAAECMEMALRTLDDASGVNRTKRVQLQGLCLYNLFILREELESVERLKQLMQRHPEVSLPAACYEVILE